MEYKTKLWVFRLLDYINIIALIMVALGALAYFMDSILFIHIERYALELLWAGIIILFILLILGSPIFSYNTKGETLMLSNHKPNIVYPTSTSMADLPKKKLLSYNITGSIIKKLKIKIHSKKRGSAILRFNVTYVSNANIKNITQDLDAIIKDNNAK